MRKSKKVEVVEEVVRVTKTAAVQEYLKSHRKALPSEIVAAMAEQGIKIRNNFASVIKCSMKKKKRLHRRKVVPAPVQFGVAEVKAAITFLRAVSDPQVVKEVLKLAQEIKEFA